METRRHPVSSAARRGATEYRSLNVCLISEEFPPGMWGHMGGGGIGTYTYNLARGLTELGHRVHVVVRGWGEETIHDVGSVRFYHVSIPEPSWGRGAYFFNVRFGETREILFWNLRVSQVVRRIHAAEPLDVIECPEYHAQGLLTALRLRRIPLVVKLHTPAYLISRSAGASSGWSRWDTLLSEHLEYRLVRRAWAVASPSRKLAEDAARQWSLNESAIHIIPNMIDDDLFFPAAEKATDSPLSNPAGNHLLYVGAVARHKGVGTLIESLPAILKAFPEVRVRIAGRDHPGPGSLSMTEHLRQRLRAMNVPQETVEFLGPVDRTVLPSAYRRAAVCVLPSFWENFPYACLEAMASGCAVVASAVGGVPEIITDEVDGLLVPARRPEALGAAVIRLLADPSLRRRLGARARATVRDRFSLGASCAQTVDLYRSLLV